MKGSANRQKPRVKPKEHWQKFGIKTFGVQKAQARRRKPPEDSGKRTTK
jgi:hypothetical protein